MQDYGLTLAGVMRISTLEWDLTCTDYQSFPTTHLSKKHFVDFEKLYKKLNIFLLDLRSSDQ